MEPLSKPLTDWLLRLNLCTRTDLRRAKGRVRQLARDLPAFDSVWIDALVHAKKITAFQARILESGHPEKLAVGPWVLVDQLGHGTSATYLARLREGQERSVLKRIVLDEDLRGPAFHRLRELVARGKDLAHAGVIAPKSCLVHQQDLVCISRYLAGPTLSQLLVRRGRFPARIVLALAKQLVDGLSALEDCGLIHGDLQLQNFRLSSAGRVVMVDGGIAPAVRPILNFHARVSPEDYDGIAPELIGTGNLRNTQSEFYALGCLLWQLLAGRPPFTTGDPLAKLMAHQTRRVPDVTDIAPDTPKELTELLRVLTEPDPAKRPDSFRAFREHFGPPRLGHRRQVARFRAAFSTAIPHVPAMRPQAAGNRWPVVAALLFLLTGATLSLMDAGAYSKLLAIPGQLEELLNDTDPSAEGESDDPASITKAKPLPAPDANGVIELADLGPYDIGRIEAVGPLTIRGTGLEPAEILVGRTSGQLSATDVVLENLRFRRAKESQVETTLDAVPLLRAASRSLIVKNCEFQLGRAASSASAAGITWKHIDPNSAANSRVAFENCHAVGAGPFCRFADWPSRVAVTDCLKSGAGRLLEFSREGQTHRDIQIQLSRVTLRAAAGLLGVELGPAVSPGSWLIQAEDSVFDLDSNSGGLFQVEGPAAIAFLHALAMQGRQCLLNSSADLASWRQVASESFQPVDASAVNVEGLVLARLKFAGPADDRPANSVLKSWEGPRFSSNIPGIDPTKWPAWMSRIR